jgi:hypothetical protein
LHAWRAATAPTHDASRQAEGRWQSRRLAAAGHFWRPSGLRHLLDGPSRFQRGEGLPIYGAANDPQSLGDVRSRQDKAGFAGCRYADRGLDARSLDGKDLRIVGKAGDAGVNAVLADCWIAVIGIGSPGHPLLRKQCLCGSDFTCLGSTREFEAIHPPTPACESGPELPNAATISNDKETNTSVAAAALIVLASSTVPHAGVAEGTSLGAK